MGSIVINAYNRDEAIGIFKNRYSDKTWLSARTIKRGNPRYRVLGRYEITYSGFPRYYRTR